MTFIPPGLERYLDESVPRLVVVDGGQGDLEVVSSHDAQSLKEVIRVADQNGFDAISDEGVLILRSRPSA